MTRCILSTAVSPLNEGENVEVHRMAPEEACSSDMLVMIEWHDRTMAVPLSQLSATDADESTVEAVADWHYWLGQGLRCVLDAVRMVAPTDAAVLITGETGTSMAVLDADGKRVLAVEISYSKDRPHFAGPANVCSGSRSVKASDSVYRDLRTAHRT